MKMEYMLWIEDIIENMPAHSFFTYFWIDMIDLHILTRWLLEGVHLQPFQMYKMKVNWKVGQRVEGYDVNFYKWKGI
jgi:hypothetical protein